MGIRVTPAPGGGSPSGGPFAPVSTTTLDLVDRTNNTTETVPAGTTTNCSTAGVTKTAPALDNPVATPPKRFAIKNLSTGTITVAYPDQAGNAQSLTMLAAETRTFRQKSTSGWGVESGANALSTLDGRFAPITGSAAYVALLTDQGVAWSTGATTIAGQVWTYNGGRYVDLTGAGGVLPSAPSTPRFIFLGVDTTGVGNTELAYVENRTNRTVADGATTSGGATVTSATASFGAGDVGRVLSGTGIPANSTITTINSATSVTISANATATATGVSITVGNLITVTAGTFVTVPGLALAIPATARPVYAGVALTLSNSTAQTVTVQLAEVSNGVDTPISPERDFSVSAGFFAEPEWVTRIAASTARTRNFVVKVKSVSGVCTVYIPTPAATAIWDCYARAWAA